MHLLTISATTLASLCATARAWEVVAYSNTYECNADSNTRYRSITGAPDLTRCMSFNYDMPGTGCVEYRNGGPSHGGCTSGSLTPLGLIMRGGRCVMFDQKDCKGNKYDSGGPINGCRNLKTGPGMAPIYSFWCSGCKIILACLAVLFILMIRQEEIGYNQTVRTSYT